MKDLKHLVWGCLLSASFFVGCSAPAETEEIEEAVQQEEQADDWQPEMYEVSDLVKVMRKIEADLKVERESLVEGGELKDRPLFYEDIKTAESTDPDEITAVYMALADKFLADYNTVVEADEAHRVEQFNGMINTCVACHKQYCQGPIPKIKKLLIE